MLNRFPENKNIDEIKLKIDSINSLYSTNIYDTLNVAKHIQSLNLDDALINGDISIIPKIATGHGIASLKSETGKEINFYAFATKYCSWHNPEEFPFFDSYIEKLLIAYREFGFYNFRNVELKQYERFKTILMSFRAYYGLSDLSLKEIDKFLLLYAKDLFKNK
ncbi:hypothetical protein [Emticicia sp. W12TSBA100-4]|uniref:hypothetical protein n=1 Tax=Emticicia sp. W12TSBA100-4 TaxID=3160965 RepID=UPI003305FAB9